MFKYQVNFLTAAGWQRAAREYLYLTAAEIVADWASKCCGAQTVLISRIWIPRTERT